MPEPRFYSLASKSRKIQLRKPIELLGSDECKFSFPGANILKFLKFSVSILIFLHFLSNQTDRWFRNGTKSLKKHSASERKKIMNSKSKPYNTNQVYEKSKPNNII
jgi:hypothetical protein